ncbi:MAG: hypothetical protein ABSF29_08180 [Tepidisphaeraceae bacterium]
MEDASQDELDGVRIRKLAALRRAAYRSRSYCIIAGVACGVGVVQLLDDALHDWDYDPDHLRPVAYFAAAMVLVALGIVFLRWAIRLNREAKRSSLAPPGKPPDFSTLSDGSQRARNLENM